MSDIITAMAWSGAVFALGFASGWIARTRLSSRRRGTRDLSPH